MDPNEALKDARHAMALLQSAEDRDQDFHTDDVTELMAAFAALDGWMSRGGFAPSAWQKVSARRASGRKKR